MEDERSGDLMSQQVSLHKDIDRLQEWSEGREDIFGGLWFDNGDAEAGTGPVTIGLATTADPQQILEEIAGLVRQPELVRITRCRWTHRELRDLRDQIMADFQGRQENGSYVSTGGLAESENVVDIGISTYDEAFAEEILDRYGRDRVRVELGVVMHPL